MTCKEHDFSQVASIVAYPVGTLDFYEPVYGATPYVFVDQLNIPEAGGVVVKFRRDSVKCQEKNSAGLHAFLHEVSLDWEFVPQRSSEYDDLVKLQYVAHEFVVKFLGGATKVIRTDSSAYSFTFSDDNGVMKCSARLNNGQGLTSVLRE